MALGTLAEFKARFPAFARADGLEYGDDTSVEYGDDVRLSWGLRWPDALIQDCLDEAAEIHALRKRSHLLCAAHLLALREQEGVSADGGSGVLASEGTGPLAQSYTNHTTPGDRSGWKAFFEQTPYGRQFLILEQRTPARVFAARIVG